MLVTADAAGGPAQRRLRLPRRQNTSSPFDDAFGFPSRRKQAARSFFLTSCRQPRRSGARPWHTVFQKGDLASKFFVRRLRLSRIPAGPSAGLLKRIAARAKACRRVSIAGARGPNVARTKARDRALPRRDEKLIYRVGRSIGHSELGRAHRHFVLAGCNRHGFPDLNERRHLDRYRFDRSGQLDAAKEHDGASTTRGNDLIALPKCNFGVQCGA